CGGRRTPAPARRARRRSSPSAVPGRSGSSFLPVPAGRGGPEGDPQRQRRAAAPAGPGRGLRRLAAVGAEIVDGPAAALPGEPLRLPGLVRLAEAALEVPEVLLEADCVRAGSRDLV